MKVLYVTNMYPVKSHKYYGIHVKEQIDYVSNNLEANTSVYFINALEKGKLEYIKSIFLIPFQLLRSPVDVIHIHYGLSGVFLMFYKPKARVFLTLHGGDILKAQGNKLQIFITKQIIKRVNKVFVLNEEMEQVIKNINVNYEILPCGVDVDFFKPKTIEKIKNNKPLILFPGDPSRRVKNFPLFKEVIEILYANNFEVNYEYIHNLTREDVVKLLAGADCLLMTSLSEGSPQIIKEALSCNLPIVSVPVGDVKNVIRLISGCYVSSGFDAHELAEMVIKVIKGKNVEIRIKFLSKKEFENKIICQKIYNNYFSI